jgi:hypothetical protein
MSNKTRALLIGGFAVVVASVAASLGGYTASGGAAATAAPTNTAPPTVSGTAREGSALTASPGTWDGTQPITFAFRWSRCDKDGGSCSTITGATDKTYTLKTVDIDNTLRVRVTARNASGSSSATSVPSAVVTAAPKAPVTGCPSGNGPAAVTDVSSPARLVIDRFQVDPGVVSRGTQTVTLKVHVSDTCNQSVQGAMVYGTAVPFAQLNVPAEQATDADGFGTLQFQVLRGFPASRNQQLLVLFLRARKPGESVLAGISSRRLVSVPVSLRT